MRVLLLLSHDVVFKPRLLSEILLRSRHDIVGVAEIRNPASKQRRRKAPGSFAFWGWKASLYLAFSIFKHKTISALPFPSIARVQSTVKRVAQHYSIPYYNVKDINSEEFISTIGRINIDVAVSFQHQIIRRQLLASGILFLNCHPAALPLYRGVKPLFWAMLNNDQQFGVTVHTVTEKIDRGKIVAQKLFRNIPRSSLLQNYHKAYSLSADVILDALDSIESDPNLDHYRAVDENAPYFGPPSSTDLAAFKHAGRHLI